MLKYTEEIERICTRLDRVRYNRLAFRYEFVRLLGKFLGSRFSSWNINCVKPEGGVHLVEAETTLNIDKQMGQLITVLDDCLIEHPVLEVLAKSFKGHKWELMYCLDHAPSFDVWRKLGLIDRGYTLIQCIYQYVVPIYDGGRCYSVLTFNSNTRGGFKSDIVCRWEEFRSIYMREYEFELQAFSRPVDQISHDDRIYELHDSESMMLHFDTKEMVIDPRCLKNQCFQTLEEFGLIRDGVFASKLLDWIEAQKLSHEECTAFRRLISSRAQFRHPERYIDYIDLDYTRDFMDEFGQIWVRRMQDLESKEARLYRAIENNVQYIGQANRRILIMLHDGYLSQSKVAHLLNRSVKNIKNSMLELKNKIDYKDWRWEDLCRVMDGASGLAEKLTESK